MTTSAAPHHPQQRCWNSCRARMKPGPLWASGTVKRWRDAVNRPPAQRKGRRRLMPKDCTHIKQIKIATTNVKVCEDCVKTGDTWVHLRLCLECGHVGCCDSSKNKHATKHFHKSKHPLIRSIEPGETWTWCYVDETFGEL